MRLKFGFSRIRLLFDAALNLVAFNLARAILHIFEPRSSSNIGVEQNRKQEFGSFQELLDLVPATFSPTCSAGPLFVLTSCFIYNVTLSGRTAFILGYLVLTEICKQKTETITSVNQNYHQVLGFEFGKVKLANKKVKLNNKFLKSVLAS